MKPPGHPIVGLADIAVDAMPATPIRMTFLTHYTELYGANRSLLALLDGLIPFGIEPSVIGPDPGDLMAALADRGIPSATWPFAWWVSAKRSRDEAAKRAIQNLRHLRPIARQMADWGTELVYSNASVFNIGAMAAAERGVPHVWHLREFGREDYDLRPDFGRRLHRLGFLDADATICVSQAIRRVLLQGADRPHVHVVYNGVGSSAEFGKAKVSTSPSKRSPRRSINRPMPACCSSAVRAARAIRLTSNIAGRCHQSSASPTASNSGVISPIRNGPSLRAMSRSWVRAARRWAG
jgi:hypothetical protein